MKNLLNIYKNEIDSLCSKYKVKTLYAFGSILNNKFNKDSDIDLLVEFHEIDLLDYGDNYYQLKFSLQDTLKKSIDLIEEKAIKNPYFQKELKETKMLIYG